MNFLQRWYYTMGRALNLLSDGTSAAGVQTWDDLIWHDRIKILRAYYDNNDLYERVKTALEQRLGLDTHLLNIRNPAHQVVEFYVSALWRGPLEDALTIEASEAVANAVRQVWNWSNWATRKQVAARWLARDGNLFIKVAQSERQRVYFQLIDALYVTEFDTDERDNLTYMRLDIPQLPEDDKRPQWHTEVWSKGDNWYAWWIQDKGPGEAVDKLGEPEETVPLESKFGIDFIPFVHAKHIDTGSQIGKAAAEFGLDDIDEANRKATRLSKQLFRHNDVTWAIESSFTDPSGRIIPPPQIGDTRNADKSHSDDGKVVNLGGDNMVRLPSGWSLRSMVPQLQYDAALAVLQDDMKELERNLPEMTYFRLKQEGELSGIAIRLKLSELISRAEEVQGNAVAALIKANKMALTLGQLAGLEGFDKDAINTYDKGGFDHTITPPEVLPISRTERAAALAPLLGNLPATLAMTLVGYSNADIAAAETVIQAEQIRQQEAQVQSTLEAVRRLREQQTDTTNIDTAGEAA